MSAIGAYSEENNADIGAFDFEPVLPVHPNPPSVYNHPAIGAYQLDGNQDIGAWQGAEFVTSTRLGSPVRNNIGALNENNDGPEIGVYGRFLTFITYEESITFATNTLLENNLVESVTFSANTIFESITVESIIFDVVGSINGEVKEFSAVINTTEGRVFVVTEDDRLYEVYLPGRDKTIY